MTGALHRVGQFWRHASASVTTDELAQAERILGPTLAPLFFQLPPNDQRHGLDVLETLLRLDPQAARLLRQAALLHDVGKRGAHFSVADRSLTVFLTAVWPRGLTAWARISPTFGERLRIYQEHARIGAERLRDLGAVDLAAVVAEHHAGAPALDATRRLQQADGRN